jgi:purine-binding chemotaxis protein CheW
VALVVDAVNEVMTLSNQEAILGETILAHLDSVTGVVKRHDGLILIHDLDRFLFLEEEQALHAAIDSLIP